jgi:hypothetical protein
MQNPEEVFAGQQETGLLMKAPTSARKLKFDRISAKLELSVVYW